MKQLDDRCDPEHANSLVLFIRSMSPYFSTMPYTVVLSEQVDLFKEIWYVT